MSINFKLLTPSTHHFLRSLGFNTDRKIEPNLLATNLPEGWHVQSLNYPVSLLIDPEGAARAEIFETEDHHSYLLKPRIPFLFTGGKEDPGVSVFHCGRVGKHPSFLFMAETLEKAEALMDHSYPGWDSGLDYWHMDWVP